MSAPEASTVSAATETSSPPIPPAPVPAEQTAHESLTTPTPTPAPPGETKGANGGIQALATSSAGLVTVSIALLGFWAFGNKSGQEDWKGLDLFVLVTMLIASACLASVPYLASAVDTQSNLNEARRWYRRGAVMTLVAIGAALTLSVLRNWKIITL
jgi:hypothetical protein